MVTFLIYVLMFEKTKNFNIDKTKIKYTLPSLVSSSINTQPYSLSDIGTMNNESHSYSLNLHWPRCLGLVGSNQEVFGWFSGTPFLDQ